MFREIQHKAVNGLLFLFLGIGLLAVSVLGLIRSIDAERGGIAALWAIILVVATLATSGLFTVQPNDAKVLTLFGNYVGTVRDAGLWWANPFFVKKRISLRIRNFETTKLKVNDNHGNPIEIDAVVVWKVVDSAEALFEVDD